MELQLSCRCGAVQGHVDGRQTFSRATCYCKDCQAFARFLGKADEILDPKGGTHIVAALPRAVEFTSGKEKLSSMSLSEKGLLRWYASCCRTPIGNTPRDSRISYVGLVNTCLSASDKSAQELLQPPKIMLNTGSALGKVQSTPIASLLGGLRIVGNILRARLTGAYKDNPFFKSGIPIRDPQVAAPSAPG